MLNQMRSSVGSIAVKILLVLLIASFAVWGVGDMITGGGGKATVATVGSVEISASTLDGQIRRETDRLRRSLGDNFSPELVKNMHLPEQVLRNLINRTLVEQESARLGFVASDADVIQEIRNNPNFQDSNGKFDKEKFISILRRNGLTEKGYVEQLQRIMGVDLLMGVVHFSAPVPDIAITTIYQALEEARTATLYTFQASNISVPEPSAEDIEAYYNKNVTTQYSTPEYRDVSYLSFTAADIQKRVEIDEEEVRAIYDERVEEFKRPERREVLQLNYDDKEAAASALEMLKAGEAPKKVASETSAQGKKPIELGNTTKDTIMEAAAEDVFALNENGATGPYQSAFGWHVFFVKSITQPTTLPFEEVRGPLENEARARETEYVINKLSIQIEDSLAAGATLKEVAKEQNLTLTDVGSVDAQGKTPDGNTAKALPHFPKFLEIAYNTDEKSESTISITKDGTYYIVRVNAITPVREIPLEKVKSQVAKAVKEANRRVLAATLALEIGQQFTDEAKRAELIKKHNLKVSTLAATKRSDEHSVPAPLIAELFEKKPGESTGIYLAQNGDHTIAVLKKIIPSKAKPSATLKDNLAKNLTNTLSSELVEQYLTHLKKRYPVTINQSALQAMTVQ